MLARWLSDLESLEAISQDDDARALFLRMAAMSRAGKLGPFVADLHEDDEVDEATKGSIAELAADESFLLAFEDYLRRTRVNH